MNRKMWRSLRAPSTSSTMKLSFSSCRCCGHSVYRGQVRRWVWRGDGAQGLCLSRSKEETV